MARSWITGWARTSSKFAQLGWGFAPASSAAPQPERRRSIVRRRARAVRRPLGRVNNPCPEPLSQEVADPTFVSWTADGVERLRPPGVAAQRGCRLINRAPKRLTSALYRRLPSPPPGARRACSAPIRSGFCTVPRHRPRRARTIGRRCAPGERQRWFTRPRPRRGPLPAATASSDGLVARGPSVWRVRSSAIQQRHPGQDRVGLVQAPAGPGPAPVDPFGWYLGSFSLRAP
jgi:hypothetical protein